MFKHFLVHFENRNYLNLINTRMWGRHSIVSNNWKYVEMSIHIHIRSSHRHTRRVILKRTCYRFHYLAKRIALRHQWALCIRWQISWILWQRLYVYFSPLAANQTSVASSRIPAFHMYYTYIWFYKYLHILNAFIFIPAK